MSRSDNSSIENRASFEGLRYANCWEDADVLTAALAPGPGKRILSIASAGDNSLSLVAAGAEVAAVDVSKTQLACVELRREAIRNLTRADCLRFLGVRACATRTAYYKEIRGGLSTAAAEYWDENYSVISSGVIHAGKFERYFKLFRRRFLPFIHSRKMIHALLQPKSREERISFYMNDWSNWRWRLLFHIFFSRFVMGRLGRDPEFFRYVDVPVSKRILERTEYALTELSTHDNPYLSYILTGNYGNALPHYLRRENYERVRQNLDKLHLIHGSVEHVVAAYAGPGWDGYNLSDIFEYLDHERCVYIYRLLLENARPSARIVYWNMLAPRECPEELRGRVKQCRGLASDLFARDRAFFYSRFLVEEVK
mgnify:CR=1 FL=1